MTHQRKSVRQAWWRRVVKDFKRNKYLYAMLLPVLGYYALFHYVPMYGAQIAFRDYVPSRGIWDSQWIGLENFQYFFESIYFWRLLRNTIAINVLDIAFGFPAPILLAILLNELTSNSFKRAVQTITYMPHFISLVVVVGMIIEFLARDGLINNVLGLVGIDAVQFLQRPEYYWYIYVGSEIWQSIGWGSIIYLAAITMVDPHLYDSAKVDGAGRLHQIFYITIPSIMPTIIILLILRIGAMMTLGYEKTILLYNPLIYETADVISSYVYRQGIVQADFGFSAAVGLFNSMINFVLLIAANRFSRRYAQTSLW
ncbi:MAG: sugar ABC transporter permease [Chloroflexi bacterium AL-W]|nr:sugar ABC transporter permease [Chloroflexi bacterium AL-N1]NOK69385.1 sugar ABC transporter permease [Chloroflexi bacterium AL-N10]NOK76446.1 sugar ABC transporter permease [Chloroflexi bacterium AL-N5]NOK83563.1 sugar ABC transporter permease [Chloroflexi bacterium AL-W]NOK91223.1 sugar ABC transporter permease [Chloroflexi bacterium AL-N15]